VVARWWPGIYLPLVHPTVGSQGPSSTFAIGCKFQSNPFFLTIFLFLFVFRKILVLVQVPVHLQLRCPAHGDSCAVDWDLWGRPAPSPANDCDRGKCKCSFCGLWRSALCVNETRGPVKNHYCFWEKGASHATLLSLHVTDYGFQFHQNYSIFWGLV